MHSNLRILLNENRKIVPEHKLRHDLKIILFWCYLNE